MQHPVCGVLINTRSDMRSPFCAGRSYGLAACYSAAHAAALIALVNSALPLPALLAMAAPLIAHGTGLLRRALLADADAPVAVYVDDTDTLLTLASGRRIPVFPSDVYCTSWLQVVRFRRQGTVVGPGFWLAVAPDSADTDSRRQLRAWLLSVPLRLTIAQVMPAHE